MSDDEFKDYYRVTEVLSKFSGLDKIDLSVLANEAERGTRCHNFCELYAKNELFVEIDLDCKPYVDSFIEWFDLTVERVEFLEKRLFCDDLRITGQMDMLAYLKGDEKPSLIDIKTPQTESKTWPLQLAAYRHLMDANSIDYKNSFVLQLNKSGSSAKIFDYTSRSEKDLELFKNLLSVHQYFSPLK